MLRQVPKRSRKNALALLKVFDEQPNEVTWDSNGHVYINEQVVPSANIYKIFPLLFKKKAFKTIPGMIELIEKIKSMGFSNLISCTSHSGQSSSPSSSDKQSSSSNNWWYIGE